MVFRAYRVLLHFISNLNICLKEKPFMVRSIRLIYLGILTLALLGLVGIPVSQAQSDQQCFDQTGFCISGRIREFWNHNGGLPVFGYPISAQQSETAAGESRAYQTQWFERARLELHPENPSPYDVQLGRIGVERLHQQGRDWTTFPKAQPNGGGQADCNFSIGVTTGHAVCGLFLDFYHQHGLNLDGNPAISPADSLALFGYPISEPTMETNTAGQQVMTQWFERARMELHPENAAPYNVELGLLGSEVRGTNNPPPTTRTATPVAVTGTLIFVSNREDQGEIYTMKPDGTNVRRLTNKAANYSSPSRSPDGNKIVFVITDSDGNNPQIYTMNADGSSRVQLTKNGSNNSDPAWSADSSKLAFASDRDGNYEIYSMQADGTDVTRLTHDSAYDVEPAWSPDGSMIAFSSNRGLPEERSAESDIYVMNTDGSNVKRVADPRGGDHQPAWSPDGKRIAFSVIGFGMNGGDIASGEVFIMEADGSNIIQLTPENVGGRHPSWSPDGSKLVFASTRNEDATFDLFTIGADRSALTKLTKNPGGDKDPFWSHT